MITHKPIKPKILRKEPIRFFFMIVLSLAIKNIVMPITGTIKMVILWANTINSNGALLNRSAIMAPVVITTAINILVLLELKLLPNPRASLINEPPIVAFPIIDEKPAANNPIRNTAEAASPNAGRSARDISVAVLTSTPMG